MIRSLRENARGLVSDVLHDVMWPVLAVLVLSHLISVSSGVMLCLLRCGGAALRVASASQAYAGCVQRISSRSGALMEGGLTSLGLASQETVTQVSPEPRCLFQGS